MAQTPLGEEFLADLGLVADEPPRTELSFARPDGVMAPLSWTGGQVDVTFVLRNLQHERRTYVWSVSVDNRTVTEGQIDLADGAWTTVPTVIPIRCAPDTPTPLVEIGLRTPAQKIGFRAACPEQIQEHE